MNCNFIFNTAEYNGYALWDSFATTCFFTLNSAGMYGGAIHGGSADYCSFSDNTASVEGNDMYGTTIINSIVKTKISLQDNEDILVAKLTNAATGKAISGAYVVFNINNVNYNVKIDSSGQARLYIGDPVVESAILSYGGNSKYAGSVARIYFLKI